MSVGKEAVEWEISHPPARPCKQFWALSRLECEDCIAPDKTWQQYADFGPTYVKIKHGRKSQVLSAEVPLGVCNEP